jgi:predicted acylesterase/phospholipase RssA
MASSQPQQELIRYAIKKEVINLALQGGGAHGAFTWGVVDRLLEDERLNDRGDQRN